MFSKCRVIGVRWWAGIPLCDRDRLDKNEGGGGGEVSSFCMKYENDQDFRIKKFAK